MNDIALAFDMGGSKLITGLVSRAGDILWKKRVEWSPKSGRDVIDALVSSGKEALSENANLRPDVIGATIPGIADPDKGIWLEASFSGIRDLPVADELSKAFALPCHADNDGQACALAERMFGAGRDCDDFLYVTVSNGVGGGVFCAGKLLRGSSGGAGEMGHCTVVEDGRPCKCGKKGCLEVYAAGPGIKKTCFELSGEEKTALELALLAREGDETALRVWELEGRYLGRAIAFAANILNPARVILGGGISLSFELYEKSLWNNVKKNLFLRPNAGLEIMPTPLGYDGGLYGAAAVAFNRRKII